LCHEKVRKEENGRQRNGDESLGRYADILWKTFILSSDSANDGRGIDRKRCECGIASQSTVKLRQDMAGMRRSSS
jgi:hypothetical protein